MPDRRPAGAVTRGWQSIVLVLVAALLLWLRFAVPSPDQRWPRELAWRRVSAVPGVAPGADWERQVAGGPVGKVPATGATAMRRATAAPPSLPAAGFEAGGRGYHWFVPPPPAGWASPGPGRAVLVFLHGLDRIRRAAGDEDEGQVVRHANFLVRMARRHGFVLAMPRGMSGAFPEHPDGVGWYPEHLSANRQLVAAVLADLRARGIASGPLVLGGFSNGAYFAALELTMAPHTPFAGFWLDGGGYPYGLASAAVGRRAFVAVGAGDTDNRPAILELVRFLTGAGWRPAVDLIAHHHAGDHDLCEEAFAPMWRFLTRTGPPAKTSAGSAIANEEVTGCVGNTRR